MEGREREERGERRKERGERGQSRECGCMSSVVTAVKNRVVYASRRWAARPTFPAANRATMGRGGYSIFLRPMSLRRVSYVSGMLGLKAKYTASAATPPCHPSASQAREREREKTASSRA